MRLDQHDVDLFFATVPVFVAFLPPAPSRDEAPQDEETLGMNNSTIDLRFEIGRLSSALSKERAGCDLASGDFRRASSALEDILDFLDNLVNDSIASHHKGQLSKHFHKLGALRHEIVAHSIIPSSYGPIEVPPEIPKWVSYLKPGKHRAAQYRRSAREAQLFNQEMDNIFAHKMVSLDVQTTQVFHRDRNNSGTELEDEKKGLAEIFAARKLCEATKSISRVMTKSTCGKSHSAYVHLSGFHEYQIETLVTLCASDKSTKWHTIRWIGPGNHNDDKGTTQIQRAAAICEEIAKRRKMKAVLRILIHSDGSWRRLDGASSDRMTTYVKPPDKFLNDLLIPTKDEEKTHKLTKPDRLDLAVRLAKSLLYLIGSPFLLDPWKSESLLCSPIGQDQKNKIYVSGTLHNELPAILKSTTPNKSFVLDLGVLLWELFFAQKVQVMEGDEESDEEDESIPLFNALNREESVSREKCVDVACLDIIANCLNAYCEDDEDDEKLRTGIYGTILKPLQEYLQSYSHPKTNKKSGVKAFQSPMSSLPYADSGLTVKASMELSYPVQPKLMERIPEQEVIQASIISDFTGNSQHALLQASTATTTDSPSWLDKFDRANTYFTSLTALRSDAVKIAILDTGCDIDDPYFAGPGIDSVDSLMSRWYDGLGESREPLDEDRDHHGTALTCLLLRLAHRAIVYVIRVARDSNGLLAAKNTIAEAILHAVRVWDVDIVSMSFGFGTQVKSIADAITDAEKVKGGKILFFAAANNDGLNGPELFPAFFESVVSARGTCHDGSFVSQYNPRSWNHKAGVQYGTLGQDVPCGWVAGRLPKSGCSVATPVMAAIAAALISLVDGMEGLEEFRDVIRTRRGLLSAFKVMTEGQNTSGERLYLAPWQLFEHNRQPLYLIGHALSSIP